MLPATQIVRSLVTKNGNCPLLINALRIKIHTRMAQVTQLKTQYNYITYTYSWDYIVCNCCCAVWAIRLCCGREQEFPVGSFGTMYNLINQFQIPIVGVLSRAYGGGSGHHHTPSHNDLPVPQGDWQEHYQKTQARYNAQLAGSVVLLGSIIAYVSVESMERLFFFYLLILIIISSICVGIKYRLSSPALLTSTGRGPSPLNRVAESNPERDIMHCSALYI